MYIVKSRELYEEGSHRGLPVVLEEYGHISFWVYYNKLLF